MIEYSIICIFLPTGKTFTFRNINLICDNESILQFSYSAMSDGKLKVATFPKATLCGWSVTETGKWESMGNVGNAVEGVD